jgi:uroporphyrinogen decarboxylase
MNSRERLLRCVHREEPDRSPYLLWDDFAATDLIAPWARKPKESTAQPQKAAGPRQWVDEWGCQWESCDATIGQAKGHPVQSAEQLAGYRIPKVTIDLASLAANRREYPDRAQSGGLSFFYYERLVKLMPFDEAMVSLAGEPKATGAFLDRLQEHYLAMVDAYAATGTVDVIAVNEDLGLQDRLAVSPAMWREVFKPRYKAVYDRAHAHGMLVFQHSCGYIQDIIPDLAEIGVDILELHQLACMDIDAVARDRGRMCITAPVDIQRVLPRGDWAQIEAFQRRLFGAFDLPEGGFMPQLYSDLGALGIPESVGERLQQLMLELRDWRRG